MKHVPLTVLFFSIGATLCAQESAAPDEDTRGVQTAERFEVKAELRYLPADYKTESTAADSKWPLLVFLHGAGERGSDLNRVKRHGPPKHVAADRDFPFIVISPQCPSGAFWNTDHILQLVKATIKEHRVDPDRVYLTGLSMGGFGRWQQKNQSCLRPWLRSVEGVTQTLRNG